MSELNDMTCAELADVAAELGLGVLTGRERALAVTHLEECDACREDVRQLMATGEQLVELLPPAEPPAGFETRVLERLGLPALAQDEDAYPRPVARRGTGPRHKRPARAGTDQPVALGAGRGGPRPPGRARRVLAAAAISLAVIAAGLGGWRLGVDNGPAASSAAGPLTSANLVSSDRQDVGEIYLYSGQSRWMYMSVDLGSGNETVTCQLVDDSGRVTTIGSFQLADGYGFWASPDPGTRGPLRGARLVDANGRVLASATFN